MQYIEVAVGKVVAVQASYEKDVNIFKDVKSNYPNQRLTKFKIFINISKNFSVAKLTSFK